MATTDQLVNGAIVPGAVIDALRMLLGVTELTDEQIAAIVVETSDADSVPNLNRAAAQAWRVKAAHYAELVNVSESGSSRSLSDMHKNALTMAEQYDAIVSAVTLEGRRRSRTRAIIRPSA